MNGDGDNVDWDSRRRGACNNNSQVYLELLRLLLGIFFKAE